MATSDKPIKVLLIEDNLGDATLIQGMLMEEHDSLFDLRYADRLSAGLKYLAAGDIDVILLDLSLPDSMGFDTFRKVNSHTLDVPIIILTACDNESLAINAVREGAQDYLVKSQVDSRLLVRALRYAVERKKIDRLKNELISVASHELRSPLTSIIGSLNLVINGDTGQLPEQARGMIDIAYRNSKRLLGIVNDLLDIRRIESGRMEFHCQTLELKSLVEQAIEENRAYADTLEVEFILDDSAPEIMVNADGERLAQVLTNLLSNAAKFSPPNSEVIVSISQHNGIEEATEFARVSVTDRGPGIPEEFRDRIFQKFAQARPSAARQRGGSGLGLSIAKAIVEGMDGRIGFETEAGSGTTFYFDLPEYEALTVQQAYAR